MAVGNVAYGGVVIRADGAVLLREPRNHFGQCAWTFAKGKPNPGETPEAAALRETEEETGLKARVVARIPGDFQGTTSVTQYFLLEESDPGAPLGAHDSETSAVRWGSRGEAELLISQSESPTVRARDLGVLEAAYRLWHTGNARPTVDRGLGRLVPMRREGSEPFHDRTGPKPFSLIDFWRWSASDLVSNATRGRLAEYIVAKAIGADTSTVRDEWAPYDLTTPEGVKVEVKSAAYLQTWHQTDLSRITFGVAATQRWDADTNELAGERSRQADAYVFALLNHQDKRTVDPLDLSQWRFFVLATSALNSRTRSQHSITIASLTALAGEPVTFGHLRSKLQEACPTAD